MDNLEEMDHFLKTNNLPRLNKEETESLKRPTRRKDIESASKTGSSGLDGFTDPTKHLEKN